MSDWRDPFADDEAAREREARRAEREARRRGEETRESLGERVRGFDEEEPAPAPSAPIPAPPTQVQSAEPPPAEVSPTEVQAAPTQVQPAAPPPPPPPPRRPTSGAVHRRRIFALVGLGLLILAVAVIGTIISRSGDSDSEGSGIPQAKKTIEVVVPEGYDRTQIAEVAKKASLKGDYLKATESFKGFDVAEYGAENAQNL